MADGRSFIRQEDSMTEIDTTVTDEQIEQFLAEHPH